MGWEMLPPEEPIWVSRCCPKSCIEERDRLRAALAALVEAASSFSKQLDYVHADPDYMGIWYLAHSHFGDYQGPKYEDEFKELKQAIAAAEAVKEG